ncbi:MAG: DNA pilot protein [Microviridae sp.]|nr:MAG: DNA pilot protein [Microviridae sp.]
MSWAMAGAIIGSAIMGSHSQHRTNKRNEANNAYANQLSQQSTAKQMAFQERMSNTAHQRQMADLRAAGINPMLSAKLGGASSPAGASYTGQKMQFQDTYAAGQRAAQTTAQIQQTQAQTRLTNIQADIAESSPKAVVSKIINAMEKGLSGKQVRGPYRMIAETTNRIVRQSKSYSITGGSGGISTKLTPELVAEVIAEVAKFGIEIPANLMEMAMDYIARR